MIFYEIKATHKLIALLDIQKTLNIKSIVSSTLMELSIFKMTLNIS